MMTLCLCHQAVEFGAGQRAVMLCDQVGNRTSGVALAMWHGLQWFIHLWAHGHREGDEHPAYTLQTGARSTLPYN